MNQFCFFLNTNGVFIFWCVLASPQEDLSIFRSVLWLVRPSRFRKYQCPALKGLVKIYNYEYRNLRNPEGVPQRWILFFKSEKSLEVIRHFWVSRYLILNTLRKYPGVITNFVIFCKCCASGALHAKSSCKYQIPLTLVVCHKYPEIKSKYN